MRYPIVLLLAMTASATPLSAQTSTRTTAQQQYKGVFEPVSYTEDIDLHSVFFANGDVGWASGKSGTIIHTKDGGAKWTAQLGGDPGDKAEKITMLRFVDAPAASDTRHLSLVAAGRGFNAPAVALLIAGDRERLVGMVDALQGAGIAVFSVVLMIAAAHHRWYSRNREAIESSHEQKAMRERRGY